MRKGITMAALVSVLAAAPVPATTAAPAPEAAAAPAKPGKPAAKKHTRRHVQHRGAHGAKPAADTTTTGSPE